MTKVRFSTIRRGLLVAIAASLWLGAISVIFLGLATSASAKEKRQPLSGGNLLSLVVHEGDIAVDSQGAIQAQHDLHVGHCPLRS